MTSAPKSEGLRALYWHSEVLRVLYWLRGEGLGDIVDAPLIEHYLGLDHGDALPHLEDLVACGHLVRDGDWFGLSARALADEEPRFATAFSDLVNPARGPCSDECWCHISAEEAECCSGERSPGGAA